MSQRIPSEQTAPVLTPEVVGALAALGGQRGRYCDSCGVVVRSGDGGVRVQGTLYCSDECADEADA